MRWRRACRRALRRSTPPSSNSTATGVSPRNKRWPTPTAPTTCESASRTSTFPENRCASNAWPRRSAVRRCASRAFQVQISAACEADSALRVVAVPPQSVLVGAACWSVLGLACYAAQPVEICIRPDGDRQRDHLWSRIRVHRAHACGHCGELVGPGLGDQQPFVITLNGILPAVDGAD